MILKQIILAGLLLVSFAGLAQTIKLEDIHVRDPYILTDTRTGWYYLYRRSEATYDPANDYGAVEVLKSRDMQHWTEPYEIFRAPDGNWITGVAWAPEVHYYRGRYYLFVTLNSDLPWKAKQPGWPAFTFRGTQIFHANAPDGPFLPFGPVPHTPMDWMALDGTLWEEDGKPYMVFCHEWVQIVDGTVELIELAPDLSAPAGRPVRLFCASAAPWVSKKRTNFVTDGCFLYRTRSDKLLMIWSGFSDHGYAVGIAESVTGRVAGPWKHHPEPLIDENGGHGMIFKTWDGKLHLLIHQSNKPYGTERPRIIELQDTGDALILKNNDR